MSECKWDSSKHNDKPCPFHNNLTLWGDEEIEKLDNCIILLESEFKQFNKEQIQVNVVKKLSEIYSDIPGMTLNNDKEIKVYFKQTAVYNLKGKPLLENTIIHEFAHCIQIQSELAKDQELEIAYIFFKNKSYIKNVISDYASKMPNEMIAECFSYYYNINKNEPLSKRIVEIFKGALNNV